MNESTSKKLFASQAILILLPLTGLWLYGGSLATYVALKGNTEYGMASSLGAALVVTLSLFSCWFLGVVFLRKGSATLFKQNGFLWAFLGIGFLYCIVGLVFLLAVTFSEHGVAEVLQFFRFGVFGLPILLPAIHLFLESRREC